MTATITLRASRTSGPTPLGIVVDAIGTTSDQTSYPYLDLAYHWNFGDIYDSTTNKVTGPHAAHVYGTAGTFTVTLVVLDRDGNTTTNNSTSITVADADTTFSGTDTIVVSTSGTFTGAPSGAKEVTSSDFDATMAAEFGTGKRVLFRYGETWTSSASTTYEDTGDAQIGAFGTAGTRNAYGRADNNPAVNGAASSGSCLRLGCQDLTVYDIDFDTVDTAGTRGIINTDNVQIADTLVWRCKFDGFEYGIQMAGAGAGVGQSRHTDILIEGCEFDGIQEYGVFGQLENSVIKNCNFQPPIGGTPEHECRLNMTHRVAVTDCNFENPVANKHAITCRSEIASDPVVIQYTGAGSAASAEVTPGARFQTTVTGGPGGEDIDVDLTDASYDTLTELVAYINGLTPYTCTLESTANGDWPSDELTVATYADIQTASVHIDTTTQDAFGRYFYCARNTCTNATGAADWFFQIGPGSTSRVYTELIYEAVFEGNTFGFTSGTLCTPIVVNTYNVMVRANGQYTTQASGIFSSVAQRGTEGPVPTYINYNNNSQHNTQTGTIDLLSISSTTATDGVLVGNNLQYVPNGTARLYSSSADDYVDGAGGNYAATSSNPFTDSANGDFTLNSPEEGIIDSGVTSISADSGTRQVYTLLDYQAKLRDSSPDVGASEDGASTWDPGDTPTPSADVSITPAMRVLTLHRTQGRRR